MKPTINDSEERNILLNVFIYDHTSDAANADVGNVMHDLDGSFFSPCELVQKHFVIGTDARASDADCAQRFVKALTDSGVAVARWGFVTPPEK